MEESCLHTLVQSTLLRYMYCFCPVTGKDALIETAIINIILVY